MKVMKKIVNGIGHTIYIVVIGMTMAMAGCRSITPVVVPPVTEELGYEVLNYKGVTTIGILETTIKFETLKLKGWSAMADVSIELSDTARKGTMDLLTLLGLGGTAALPLALKKLPKGAVRKDEKE